MTSGIIATAPSLEEARGLSASYNVIPVSHRFLDDTETPVSAFLKLRQAGRLLPARERRARSAAGPLLLPGHQGLGEHPADRGHRHRAPRRGGHRRTTWPPTAATRSRSWPAIWPSIGCRPSRTCRPSWAAPWATSATTACATSSTFLRHRPTIWGCPTWPSCSPTSSWCSTTCSTPSPCSPTSSATRSPTSTRPTRPRSRAWRDVKARLRAPLPAAGRRSPGDGRPAPRRRAAPRCGPPSSASASWPRSSGSGSTSAPATPSRWCCPSASSCRCR